MKKIAKRTLGQVTGDLVGSMKGDTEAFCTYFKSVVDKREVLVHHFNDTYGKLIAAKQHHEVLDALKTQHLSSLSAVAW